MYIFFQSLLPYGIKEENLCVTNKSIPFIRARKEYEPANLLSW